MTEAIRHPRSLDWNPVKSFTEESTDGPCRARRLVALTKMSDQTASGLMPIERGGVVDFGLLNPGQKSSFHAIRNWSKGMPDVRVRSHVQPGESLLQTTPPIQSCAGMSGRAFVWHAIGQTTSRRKDWCSVCGRFAYSGNRALHPVDVVQPKPAHAVSYDSTRLPANWSPPTLRLALRTSLQPPRSACWKARLRASRKQIFIVLPGVGLESGSYRLIRI